MGKKVQLHGKCMLMRDRVMLFIDGAREGGSAKWELEMREL